MAGSTSDCLLSTYRDICVERQLTKLIVVWHVRWQLIMIIFISVCLSSPGCGDVWVGCAAIPCCTVGWWACCPCYAAWSCSPDPLPWTAGRTRQGKFYCYCLLLFSVFTSVELIALSSITVWLLQSGLLVVGLSWICLFICQ